MGWKAYAILATDQPAGYFGSSPEHDAERANHLIDRLGFTNWEFAGLASFESASLRPRRSLFLGAYEQGVAVCHRDAPFYFFTDRAFDRMNRQANAAYFKQALLGMYPTGQLLAFTLQSALNYWGFVLYENGMLVRSASGDADEGLIQNIGDPLPEEKRVLNACPIEKVDKEALGEDLVFDVTTRFFGQRLDDFEGRRNLQMSQYRPKPGLFGTTLRQLSSFIMR